MRRPARLALLAQVGTAVASTLVPRWGHAVAYLSDPPALLIQGGKTDASSVYTYSSAPNSADSIVVALDSGFDTSSPPATLVSDSGPNYTWHCLSPLGTASGVTQLLSFGGDGGWSLQSDTTADSAWLFDIDSGSSNYTFTHEATGWADQPTRRIQQSCAAANGTVYITGGVSNDGSNTAYSDAYAFSTSTSSFAALASLPIALYHHVSPLLSNGTLLVFSGVYISTETSNPTLSPLSTIYTLDTTSSTATWQTITVPGTVPIPRRGASATLNADGTIFIFGGADVDFSQVYGDGWVFNPTTLAFTEVLTLSSGPGARFDHSGISVGDDQVLVFGGYAVGAPADADIHIVSVSSGATTTVNPLSGATATTTTDPTASTVTSFTPSSSTASGTAALQTASGVVTDASGATITGSVGGADSQTEGADDGSVSTTTETPVATSGDSHRDALSTARLIALITTVGGSLALIFLVLLLLLWRRRRRRQLSGRGDQRVYTEKGEGKISLITDPESGPDHDIRPPEPTHSRSKEAITALGIGLGRVATKIHRKVSGGPNEEYSVLKNEPPKRRSTRRVGQGIRLIGVTPDIDDQSSDEDDYARPSAAYMNGSRREMLLDEDTRRFSVDAARRFDSIPEEEASLWKRDFAIDGGDLTTWRTADSLLDKSTNSCRFIKGGPVPTPVDSLRGAPLNTPNASMLEVNALGLNRYSFANRSMDSLTPSDAISSRGAKAISKFLGEFSEPPSLELDPFLVAIANGGRLAGNSVPSSAHHGTQSARSTESLKDLDCAMISGAEAVTHPSATASLVNVAATTASSSRIGHAWEGDASATASTSRLPPTWEGEADLGDMRNMRSPPRDPLLRRISTNIKARVRGASTPSPPMLDVRDPAPQPTDWPLQESSTPLTNSLSSSDTWSSTAPSADIYPPNRNTRLPSLTDVGSVRSMRDMEVVQRDMSAEDFASDQGVLERLAPSATNSEVSVLGVGFPPIHRASRVTSIPLSSDLGLDEFGPTSPVLSPNTTPLATPRRPELFLAPKVTPQTPSRRHVSETQASPQTSPQMRTPVAPRYTSFTHMTAPLLAPEPESPPLADLRPPSSPSTSAAESSSYATPMGSPEISTTLLPMSSSTSTIPSTPPSLRTSSSRHTLNLTPSKVHTPGHTPNLSTSSAPSSVSKSRTPSHNAMSGAAAAAWAPLRTPNRRGVGDIVNSINKRGGGIPSQFTGSTPASPTAGGSATASPVSGLTSPTALRRMQFESGSGGALVSPTALRKMQFETATRSPLRVANPDKSPEKTP